MAKEHAAIKNITETVTAFNTNRFMENPSFFKIIIEVDFQENKEM
ncbi:hypothetical protein bthur0014_17280 [Bacillus thuringiensis IBL 4222]|nr:hypothetical protein bthur0004_17720 [Bacillus thuringiensis serovar sotto str. T04001]EEN03564.1 hypothetical protein bthur0014_17280 [Bacillus thuringiensis IBL 4222]